MSHVLTRVVPHGQKQGGTVILDVASVDALRNARPTVSSLSTGDSGQIIIQGPGLGVAADFAGAEAVWRKVMGEKGFSIQDIHGEGFSTAIIDWSIPQAPAGQGEAPMSAIVVTLVLVGVILAAILLLGWLVLGRLQILLFGMGGPGGFGIFWLVAGGLALAAVAALRPGRG